MNITKKIERIKLEEKLVKSRLPKFRMYERNGLLFFFGLVTTELGNKYKLRLVLDPKKYPYTAPKLFLVSSTLWTSGGRKAINSLSLPHTIHTKGNGTRSVQISYTGKWDASNTCVAVLTKGIIWINFHEKSWGTGRNFV